MITKLQLAMGVLGLLFFGTLSTTLHITGIIPFDIALLLILIGVAIFFGTLIHTLVNRNALESAPQFYEPDI